MLLTLVTVITAISKAILSKNGIFFFIFIIPFIMNPLIFLYVYLVIVNIVSIIITVYDKHCAVKNKWRVKESTLLLFSALGGSVSMYIIMQLIRHKTKKLKFMLGIPLIIVLQFIIYALVNYYVL